MKNNCIQMEFIIVNIYNCEFCHVLQSSLQLLISVKTEITRKTVKLII